MLEKVRGQFDVQLSVPINLDFGVGAGALSPIAFPVQDGEVTVLPLGITPAMQIGANDYDPPELASVRVWITRECSLTAGDTEPLLLGNGEQEKFEQVLVEATTRFVTAVKQRTADWSLDTRHPIHAYSYDFSSEGRPVTTTFPLKRGHKIMPGSAMERLPTSTADLVSSLSADEWNGVAVEIASPIVLPVYDEFLYDAKKHRYAMHYDVALLFAAIAAELVLTTACRNLLKKRGLTDGECHWIMKPLRNDSVLDLVRELAPQVDVTWPQLRKFFELRNATVHRGKPVTWEQAADGIQTAEALTSSLKSAL